VRILITPNSPQPIRAEEKKEGKEEGGKKEKGSQTAIPALEAGTPGSKGVFILFLL